MKSLILKEVNAFFGSLLGYLILSLFLTAMGLIVWVFPETSVLEYGYADLEPLFLYGPYVFIFLIPALSMRAIAEERRNQTWELLQTAPLTMAQVVLAKYVALLFLIVLAMLPTLLYLYSVIQLGDPVGNIDQAGFFGSWVGLFFLGAVFGAVGIFTSSISSQQVVAFVLGVFLCFLLYSGFGALSDLPLGSWGYWFEEMSLSFHYEQLSRGVIDSGDIFFFLAAIWVFLGGTILLVNKR